MLKERQEVAIPTDADARLAGEAGRALAAANDGNGLRVRLVESGQELILPHSVHRLLIHLLTEMSRGNAVTLIPVHAELTTQEAADFLNVSRPYLIRLLESGQLRYRTVGSHRRVRFDDLSEFKRRQLAESQSKLEQLAAEAQKLGFGY